MVSRSIVNFADGRYIAGQKRLYESITKIPDHKNITCFCAGPHISMPCRVFTDHRKVPYFFKVESLIYASSYSNLLLWLDASLYATGGSLHPIFDYIERQGYLLEWGGWNNAQWCNDASLAGFGFTRDEAEKQRHVRSGMFGISLVHAKGRQLLESLVRYKLFFCGARENRFKSESLDPRCFGHRQDQSVLSLIAARHGYEVIDEVPGWFCYGTNRSWLLNIDGSVNHKS